MATFSATEISKLCVREAENKITGITLFILFSVLHFRLLQHTVFCNVEISIIWNFILLYTSARSTRFLFLSSPITPFSQSRNLSHNTYCDTAIARCDWLVPFPFLMYYITQQKYGRPIPVAARSKAFLCGRSLGGIAGLNPAGGVDGRLLCLLCVVQVAASANELITRSEKSYPLCVSNCVWSRKFKRSGLGPIWTVASQSRNKPKKYYVLNDPTKNILLDNNTDFENAKEANYGDHSLRCLF